jgi:PAS domain-containing protein
MKRVCAWCGAGLASAGAVAEAIAGAPDQANVPVSHGVCPSCYRRLLGESVSDFAEFLETLGAPVLLVDADVSVREANSRALALLGKKRSELSGRRGGEVIECGNSRLPGGCGQQDRCRTGCVIRRSVTHTLATSQAVVRAEAVQEVFTSQGVGEIRFRISTEKAGNLVLLRIEAAPTAQNTSSST